MTHFELRNSDVGFSVNTRRTGSSVEVELNGKLFVVNLKKTGEPNRYAANIGDDLVTLEVETLSSTTVALKLGGERLVFQRTLTSLASRQTVAGRVQDQGNSLTAPMPGRIVRLHVEKGQSVKEGDPLVVIESMKMESVLRSSRRAIVNEILVTRGDSVKRGQELIRFGEQLPT